MPTPAAVTDASSKCDHCYPRTMAAPKWWPSHIYPTERTHAHLLLDVRPALRLRRLHPAALLLLLLQHLLLDGRQRLRRDLYHLGELFIGSGLWG